MFNDRFVIFTKSLNYSHYRYYTLTLPRGMKDFEGKDSAQIEHVRKEFLHVSGLYGFEYVDPSPMENLSTLETRSGPAIRDEIYHFKDKGGRDVALRFDFTMGLARRAASQRSEKLPSKVSSFGGVFRYDEPQKGRYRYFHQWDFEVFGKPTIQVDAEIVEMTSTLFDSLGLGDEVYIHISHRNLIESKIRQVCGDDFDDIPTILRAVDKIAKKPKQDIIDEYVASTVSHNNQSTDNMRDNLAQILDFASIRGDIKTVASTAGNSMQELDGWEHLMLLFDSLQSRGVCNAKIDLGIVRGLDYYSGMVFEVFYDDNDGKKNNTQHDDHLPLGALAGGGRYDALMNAFGRSDLGAAGVAGGVERIILAMNQKRIFDDVTKSLQNNNLIAVLYATPATQNVAAQIASVLRKNDIHAEFDIAGRNLKKQLAYATTQKHAHAIILVGPRELEQGNVVLRLMDTDIQHTLSLDELLGKPHELLMPLI